ncbi:MAG TPA: hypothetical protein VKW76_07000 [Candidatus Binatia bacterium]|nr:hypothetical protein [Candidatus Binatia bacterium]
MQKRVRASITLALLVGAFVAVASATPVFLVDSDQTTYDRFFRVDPATGQLTALGSVPFAQFGAVLALAAASDDLLYAVAEGGAVLQMNVTPFSYTVVGEIGPNGVVGLGYAPDGRLYATDEVSNVLSVITPSPFGVTSLGTIHVGTPSGVPLTISGGDLAEDASGAWYLWTNSTQALYRLDVTSAVATPLSPQSPGSGSLSGLAFDYDDGALLASTLDDSGQAPHALLTLDPTTGAVTRAVSFCLSCPAVYPAISGDLASPPPGPAAPGAGTTTSTTLPCAPQGYDGLLCALGSVPSAALCPPGQMNAHVERRVSSAIAAVRRLIAAAEAGGGGTGPSRRAKRLLERARRRLAHVRSTMLRTGEGARSPHAAPQCRQAVAGWITDLEARTSALLAF